MFRLIFLLLACLSLLFGQASAGELFSDSSNRNLFGDASREQFLPVNQAFQASTWRDESRVYVGFRNAEGYYLYRHQFALESRDDGVKLGDISLPPGEFKQDEFLGEVHVFYGQVVLSAPIDNSRAASVHDTPIPIRVTFQGCADAGLCYPPEHLQLTALPGSPPADFANARPVGAETSAGTVESRAPMASPASSASPKQLPLSEDGRFRSLLDTGHLPVMLGLFFLAGLGLTFTPCVLPMIPILSSIIVGQRASRRRAFMLSASYVAGMSVTYALVGILMGLFGAGLNLQARLQSPWILIPFALLFVAFALAMFGAFNLRLPARLATRVDGWQARLQRSGPLGLAAAGALSVLVVSPCVSAPLAGALMFISTTGQAGVGAGALFVMALGMGVPLMLVGTLGSTLLPHAGAWMNGVKSAFGVLLLAVAIWLVERLLPGPSVLLLWGALAIGTALALGALTLHPPQGWPRVRQAGGIMLLIWGIALVWGAAHGAHDPLRPLAGVATSSHTATPTKPAFTAVTTSAELDAQLALAGERPVFVDVSADWCISCKLMERDVFPAPEVADRLDSFVLIRADVTDNTPDSRALLARFGLFGPPSLLFFHRGKELESARIQGEIQREALAKHLDQVLNTFDT
ncbi:protein-disulfide reductase DsbD [Halomonas shantousis]